MDPTEKLDDMLTSVSNEESFLKFVEALISERKRAAEAEKKNPGSPWGPDAGRWENTSIETFLESAVAWAADTNFGFDQGLTVSNRWKGLLPFFLLKGFMNNRAGEPVRLWHWRF
jgi:hypothetical protein